jgi:hypothetical protein
VVVDGKDIDLIFGYDLINDPVVSKNKFPEIFVI